MEKHSSGQYRGDNSDRGQPSVPLPRRQQQQPIEFVTCTCPVPPLPRVCNVDGCTTILSRFNKQPFCNSCRKAYPYKLLVTPCDGRPQPCHPRDYDGITDHQCTT